MIESSGPSVAKRLGLSIILSVLIAGLVVLTSAGSTSRLGVAGYWPWLLTGLQVLSLWAAGATKWWGWVLGASVQPAWIVYAILSAQYGFIPGCAISTLVQVRSQLRGDRAAGPGKERSPIDVSAYGASRSVPPKRSARRPCDPVVSDLRGRSAMPTLHHRTASVIERRPKSSVEGQSRTDASLAIIDTRLAAQRLARSSSPTSRGPRLPST